MVMIIALGKSLLQQRATQFAYAQNGMTGSHFRLLRRLGKWMKRNFE